MLSSGVSFEVDRGREEKDGLVRPDSPVANLYSLFGPTRGPGDCSVGGETRYCWEQDT